MAKELDGMRIAVLATDGVEQSELEDPWAAMIEAGAVPSLVSPASGRIRAAQHAEKGDSFDVDLPVNKAYADDFDALVLPGGVANPDKMRMDHHAVDFVRAIAEAGTPIGVICHGPWMLVEADVVRDRTLTSYPSLRTDLINAGATWVDEPVVICGHGPGVIVSSRDPDDLPVFCETIIEQFHRSR